MSGFIVLHRKLQEWEWYATPYMVQIFIHFLLEANHKDKKWKGIDIKRGQFVTGYHALSEQTGISIRSLRTCIERLKTTGELTVKTTNKYSLVTVTGYEYYQNLKEERQAERQASRHSSDKQTTTTNELNKLNKDNKETLKTGFEFLWNKYPKKVRKPKAEEYFYKTVKNETDLTRINKALDNYLKMLSLPENDFRKPQDASTWFNNWEDWEEMETQEGKKKELLVFESDKDRNAYLMSLRK